jgi:hypothetical protein
MGRGSVSVQPAGSAGKRQVFLTLTLHENDRQVEFVLSEHAAYRLGEALVSGAHGIMREFDLAIGGE